MGELLNGPQPAENAAPNGVEASNRRRRRRFRLGFSGVKRALIRMGYACGERLPIPIFNALLAVSRPAVYTYWHWPRCAVRRNFENFVRLAAARGYTHDSKDIVREQLSQTHAVARLYLRLLRSGIDAVMPSLWMSEEDRRRLDGYHHDGAFMLVVPHNFAGVLYALKMAETIDVLIVSQRAQSPEVQRITEDMAKRLELEMVFADRANPIGLNRHVVRSTAQGKALVVTVDKINRREGLIRAGVFGEQVGFNPWAFRLAAKQRIPVIPAFVGMEDGKAEVRLGERISSEDPAEILQASMSFFEEQILQDPASWAFLSDKRWGRVLQSVVDRESQARDLDPSMARA